MFFIFYSCVSVYSRYDTAMVGLLRYTADSSAGYKTNNRRRQQTLPTSKLYLVLRRSKEGILKLEKIKNITKIIL